MSAELQGQAPVEAELLRDCLRDVASLVALPALWSGQSPREILRSLCQVLEAVLPLEFVLATSLDSRGEPLLRVARFGGRWLDSRDPGLERLLAYCRSTQERPSCVDDAQLGTLHVMRVDMGYYGRTGSICVGSRRAGFPSPGERVVLGTAATLVGGSLNSARLLMERERAMRAKDEFLAMLGHELRNPLSPIATALQLIKMRAGAQFTREQEIIERQLEQLTRLVDDLLDVSRVTSGKVLLHIERMVLRDAVAKAVELAAPVIQERRHLLNVDVPAAIAVDADVARISQVLQNLLTNAAKYTEPGGSIDLVARVEGSDVRVSVRDNGTGIDPALLPSVFDLFIQGPVLLDRSRGGLGIGLALVKSLVALHGGRVAATSRGVGQGSEFTLWLPLRRGGEFGVGDAPRAPAAGELAPVGDEILVVDDNVDAAVTLAQLLQTAGYRVNVAHDGPAALKLSSERAPRTAILDIGLPGMSGYELAERMRVELRGACPRLIALTGYGQESDRERAFEAGFDWHLVKPVDIARLLAYLREARVNP